MKKSNIIIDYFDEIIPEPRCELEFNQGYELLIAVVLSAQCTDKRVNMATKVLFSKYKNLDELVNANIDDIQEIIRSLGSYTKKSAYVIDIAKALINDYNRIVPKTLEELTKISGVGRKSANVVLSVLYDVPSIAVDTHVMRVSKRLELADSKDNPDIIEKKLEIFFPKERWIRTHYQMVLFGRYKCKAVKPICNDCKLIDMCIENNKNLN